MTTQSDFDYARAHPEMREEFVRAVEREYASPYIARMRYSKRNPTKKRKSTEEGVVTLMNCGIGWIRGVLAEIGIPRPRSDVTVFPNAFERLQSLESFMLCIDHEELHAADFSHRRDDGGYDDICDILFDADAWLLTKVSVDGDAMTTYDALEKWRTAWYEVNAYSGMIANLKGRDAPPEFIESCQKRLAHYSARLAYHRAMFTENPVFQGLRQK